jgi:hypothetical protein
MDRKPFIYSLIYIYIYICVCVCVCVCVFANIGLELLAFEEVTRQRYLTLFTQCTLAYKGYSTLKYTYVLST